MRRNLKRPNKPFQYEHADMDGSVVVFRLWWVLLALLGVGIVALAVWTADWLARVVTRIGA